MQCLFWLHVASERRASSVLVVLANDLTDEDIMSTGGDSINDTFLPLNMRNIDAWVGGLNAVQLQISQLVRSVK
jgi:hypothetical protein